MVRRCRGTERLSACCLPCGPPQVRINYANPDMVGHTGDLEATKYACEVVDKCLGELLEVADQVGARYLVTADHGNADDMVQRDKKGKPLVRPGGALCSGWGGRRGATAGRNGLQHAAGGGGAGCGERSARRLCGVVPRGWCAQVGEDGKPLPLTSHTLAPVPVFIGGKGLPDNVVFRCACSDTSAGAGLWCLSGGCRAAHGGAHSRVCVQRRPAQGGPGQHHSHLHQPAGPAAPHLLRAVAPHHQVDSLCTRPATRPVFLRTSVLTPAADTQALRLACPPALPAFCARCAASA